MEIFGLKLLSAQMSKPSVIVKSTLYPAFIIYAARTIEANPLYPAPNSIIFFDLLI